MQWLSGTVVGVYEGPGWACKGGDRQRNSPGDSSSDHNIEQQQEQHSVVDSSQAT